MVLETALCIAKPDSGIVRRSPADGGLVIDRYNKVQCGVRRCVLDIRGKPFCSKAVGGAAARGQYGDAVRTDGCVPTQADMCSQLKRRLFSFPCLFLAVCCASRRIYPACCCALQPCPAAFAHLRVNPSDISIRIVRIVRTIDINSI
ncbi:MAG: hypothetical protein V4573_08720 [Pseudomonadota bacterium]